MKDSLKKFRISLSPRTQIEPEEIFFDSAKIKEFEDEEADIGKFEKEIAPRVFFSFAILQYLTLLFIGAMSAFLFIQKGDQYAVQAQDNSSRIFSASPERGAIYSSDGKTLAQNETYFDLYILASKIPQGMGAEITLRQLSYELGQVLRTDEESIYQKFARAKEGTLSEFAFAKGLNEMDISELSAYIARFPFFEVRQSFRRRYQNDVSFSHVIGYTGEVSSSEVALGEYVRGTRTGKMGVEAFYDETLRGKEGVFIKKINSRGQFLSEALRETPKRGEDITLHLNAEMQKKTYDILKRHARALDIDAAVGILLNPQTGGVISLVSIPGFDANLFEKGISHMDFENLITDERKPLFNRAISGEYPSGSTIKPIIASAALEERLVTPQFLVYSAGSIEVPSAYDSDVLYVFKDWKAHGWTDMRKAIADSVNVYFYTIGGGYRDVAGLGIKKIEEYLQKFGWGNATGIDLPGEALGLIPTPKWKKGKKGENWYIGDTYITSIGQGDILTTPLQIAASTAVFANGGTLLVPAVVAKIGERAVGPNVRTEGFVTWDNIQVVREGMRRAVETGSSRFLASLPYPVAGKTGTAQTGRARNHAWFTGFAPYEDPEIVVTILLEEGEKSDYAVRAAKDILEAYFVLYPQQ